MNCLASRVMMSVPCCSVRQPTCHDCLSILSSGLLCRCCAMLCHAAARALCGAGGFILEPLGLRRTKLLHGFPGACILVCMQP